MGRKKEPWKQEHDRIYGQEAEESKEERVAEAKRENTAAAILRGLRKNNIWFAPTNNGQGFHLKPTDGRDIREIVSEDDLKLIMKHMDILKEMTANRTLDGTIDGRLVFFLADTSYYDGDREERYTFPAGSLRLVRADLAEKLVATPSAEYHPGPEGGE